MLSTSGISSFAILATQYYWLKWKGIEAVKGWSPLPEKNILPFSFTFFLSFLCFCSQMDHPITVIIGRRSSCDREY